MSSYDNEATNEDISGNVTIAYIGAIAYITYIIICLIGLILHTIKLYQDFYTDERKSLAHLIEKPKITPIYTAIVGQTQAAVILFLVADICEATTYWWAHDEVQCDSMQTAAGITYQVGQTFMYLLLLTRLYWTYSTSTDPVSANKIIVYSIIIILYNVIIIVTMATIWTSQHPYTYDGATRDVNYCNGTLEPVTGTLMTVQEIVITIAFLYVFYKQFVMTVADKNADPVIIYSGRQLFILSAVSMVLTAIIIMATAITDINFIIGADTVVNVICLLMLEPYFEGEFYQKLCCPFRYIVHQCICCEPLKTSDFNPTQLAKVIDDSDNSKGAPLLAVKRAAINSPSAAEAVAVEMNVASAADSGQTETVHVDKEEKP